MMKFFTKYKITIFLKLYGFITLFFAAPVFAQIQEIGIGVSSTYFSGDIGPKLPYTTESYALNVVYKLHFTDRISFAGKAYYGSLSSYDKDAKDNIRKQRDQGFHTGLTELSSSLEFNFFRMTPLPFFKRSLLYTPYIHAGMGVLFYTKKNISATHRWKTIGGTQVAPVDNYDFESVYTPTSVNDYALVLPFGVGFKFLLYRHIMLDFSFSLRYTFSDDIDSNQPIKEEYSIEPRIARDPYATVIKERDLARYGGSGDVKNTDWYAFLGVSVSYVFGDLPCACGQ